MTRRAHLLRMAISLAIVSVAAGCSDSLPSLPRLSDLNPWAEKQVPLPGKRVAVKLADGATGSIELASAERPVTLPLPQANESWPQSGGPASNAPGHLALPASIRIIWSADVGQGSSKLGRLTAVPVVVGGKVFTLDAAGRVTALTTSGAVSWRADLTPPNDKDYKAFGGGITSDSGRVFAATGHGMVVALDAQTGKKLWEKPVGSPIRSAPTTSAGRVVVVATDGRTVALSALDGAEMWVHRGLPQHASLLTSTSSAIDGDLVIVPYPTGEIVALRAVDGTPAWSESLARRRTASSLGSMSDAARPAVDAGTVFAIGHAGRMVATSARTGERIWSLNIPGIQTPYVAGDTVYVVDTTGQVIALGRREGKALWTTKLSGAKSWSGPVLAGGRLWLTSDKGQLVAVNAITGKLETQLDLGGPVFVPPVVAGGRMYVLTDRARLVALN